MDTFWIVPPDVRPVLPRGLGSRCHPIVVLMSSNQEEQTSSLSPALVSGFQHRAIY